MTYIINITDTLIIIKTNGTHHITISKAHNKMTFYQSHLTYSHKIPSSQTPQLSPRKKAPSLQSLMLLSKQNIDQSTIISSQATQILLLREQVERIKSNNAKLRDLCQQYKLKYQECKAVSGKVQVVKDSLTADFNMLKNVIVQGQKHRKYIQKQNAMLKLQLQHKQQQLQILQQQIRTFQRQSLSLTHHLQSHQQNNTNLHEQIRALKILNIQSKLSCLSLQDKQNYCIHVKNSNSKNKNNGNNSGSKTIKKKNNKRKSVNLSAYVGTFNHNNANDV